MANKGAELGERRGSRCWTEDATLLEPDVVTGKVPEPPERGGAGV